MNFKPNTRPSRAIRERCENAWQRRPLKPYVRRIDPNETVPNPLIFKDGDSWLALQGKDLHSGVVGYGDTRDEAKAEFVRAWKRGERPQIVKVDEGIPGEWRRIA